MAKRKPSERRHNLEPNKDLNLIPIMNLIVLLIPILLLQMAMLQIAVINVSAPKIGSGSTAPKKKKKDEKPPLNLTITISKTGFYISGRAGTLGGAKPPEEEGKKAGPTISVKDDGTYDYNALTQKIIEIKDSFPEESQVIINPEGQIKYKVLIEVLDATRESSDGRILFPDVVISAGFA